MIRISKINKNDIANGPGVRVSVFVQGCPEPHCKGCFNPETWDFNAGTAYTLTELETEIEEALFANGIKRNLSFLGGEPLSDVNISTLCALTTSLKEKYPNLNIYLWTKYRFEQLIKDAKKNHKLKDLLNNIDVIIDGPYVEELRDITLKWRGSSNQRIIKVKEKFEK